MPPADLTPELAVRRLRELSGGVRAAVLLDARGELAAWRAGDEGAGAIADEPARLAARVRRLMEAADQVESAEPWAQVEVLTPAGAVFAVRERGWTLAAACERDVLPSLMFFDLRSVLDGLGHAVA